MIAPAKTGRERRSRNAVTKTDHTNKGSRSKDTPGVRIFITVVINFIEAKMEDAPAK